jgi:hypothetical protein
MNSESTTALAACARGAKNKAKHVASNAKENLMSWNKGEHDRNPVAQQ